MAVLVGSAGDREPQSPADLPCAGYGQPGTTTTLLLAAAGVLLLAGVDGGVYVVVPSVIAAMTGGVASAWLFLTRITA